MDKVKYLISCLYVFLQYFCGLVVALFVMTQIYSRVMKAFPEYPRLAADFVFLGVFFLVIGVIRNARHEC